MFLRKLIAKSKNNNILSSNKKYLDIILNAIQEKILLLDEDGNVIYTNYSFEQFFYKKKSHSHSQKNIPTHSHIPKGLHYKKIINIPKFVEFVDILQTSTSSQLKRELHIYEHMFQLTATTIDNPKAFIIIFLDISEERKAAQIKKDFIANASHELRTPLTAIKGYIELLQESPDKHSEFIDIISRNTNRIINIVNDLLKISEIEEENVKLDFEECNINEIIREIITLFEQKLQEKNLMLSLHLTPNSTLISADKIKLEDVFINLIDNAIKYTEQGSLSIRTNSVAGTVEIRIKDTGIGIPTIYHQRVFERFFVVDSNRSKKTGGTGLGLSIVKHIIHLHKGTIDMFSEQGYGTEFVIRFPLG